MTPPDDLPDLGNIWKDLGAYRSFLTGFHEKLTNPAQREVLGALMQRLDEQVEEAKKLVPGFLEGMKNDVERMKIETEAEVLEFDRRCKEVEAQIMARQHEVEPPPAPVPPAPPAVSPNLAPSLAAELMGHLYGPEEKETDSLEDGGSVARAWTDETEEAEAPVAPPPTSPRATPRPAAPAPPPAKPEPTSPKEDDLWEGLSRMED